MEIDLKKAFYIIICITLIAIVSAAMATPIMNKINAQQTKIENVQFEPKPNP